MAVTEGIIPVSGTTANLDTVEVTQEDGVVAHREMVSIGDPQTTAARASVSKQALSTQYGVTVRDPRLDDVVLELHAVVAELKEIRMHLNLMTEFES